jgi:hypothetical protein
VLLLDKWSDTPNVQLLIAGAVEIERLNALTGGGREGEDLLVVPRIPTAHMIERGSEWTEPDEIWAAMITAMEDDTPSDDKAIIDRGGPPLPGVVQAGSSQIPRR